MEERASRFGDEMFKRTCAGKAAAPAIWPLEVGNALLVALRKRRVSVAQFGQFVQLIETLPIDVESQDGYHVFRKVLPLAERYDLSSYDAAYLELAMRRGIPLASLDARLKSAASAAGIATLPS